MKPKKQDKTSSFEYPQVLAVFDSFDHLVYASDPKNYDLLYLNKVARKTFGNKVGQKCYQVLQGLKSPCPFCTNKFIFGKNAVNPYIWEFKNKINQHWYHCIDRAIRWMDGRSVRFEIALDIMETKCIEESLKDSEERYRKLAESAQDYIFIIGKDWNVQYVNEFAARQFGHSAEQIIGKKLDRLFPKEIVESHKAHLDKVIRSGKPCSFEDKMKNRNKELWLDTKLIPINGPGGKLTAVMGISRDIGERKKIEQILVEKERFLNNIFTSIQDGISIIDKDLNILRVNPVMKKWYSYNRKFVGKKCYQVYHGRNTPCESCPSRRTIQSGKLDYEVVPKRNAAGKVIGWFDLYSFPLLDEKTGQMNGVIEYVRDITARRLIENKLVLSNKKLKQLSLKDPQTDLFNHRYLNEILEAEFHRAKRYNYPLSVLMLDIDYFKSINDVYGHQFGDLVLRQLADQLKKMVRRYDTLIRYGGEEFLIISPVMDRQSATVFAQRVLGVVNLYGFGNAKHKVKLKVSIAVVSFPEDPALKGMELVEQADNILNKAKESGGNKVYSSITNYTGIDSLNKEHVDVKTLEGKISKLTKRANQSLIEAIFAFAKTIEVKDHYTGEHVERTVRYAMEIAWALKLPDNDVELIRQASMLHDLGKIGISEKILSKRGKLTDEEFLEIKKHPQIGVDIIRPIHFLHSLIPFILHHHERWDGRGYPHGLKKDSIPLGARIVAIADVYQALISDRPYRKAYSEEEALQIMQHESGLLFDPEIVDVFINILQKEKQSPVKSAV